MKSWFEFALVIPLAPQESVAEIAKGLACLDQARNMELFTQDVSEDVLTVYGEGRMLDDEIAALIENCALAARWLQKGPQPATLETTYVGRDCDEGNHELHFIGTRAAVTEAICNEIEGQIVGLREQMVRLLKPFSACRHDEYVVSEAM